VKMNASVTMATSGMLHNASLTVQILTTQTAPIMEQKPVTVMKVTYGTMVPKTVGFNVNY
jgi:hypothetical protein